MGCSMQQSLRGYAQRTRCMELYCSDSSSLPKNCLVFGREGCYWSYGKLVIEDGELSPESVLSLCRSSQLPLLCV